MEKRLIKLDPSSIIVCAKESPESCVKDGSPPAKVPTKPKRRFRQEWAQRFPWLRNKRGKAYCTVCTKSIANMLSNIERHNKQKYHQRHLGTRHIITIDKFASEEKKLENQDLQETCSEDQYDQYDSNLDSDVAEVIVSPNGPCRKITSDARDSHQIFADYVADQMRSMTDPKQRRLKLLIQKAIIEIEEGHDDINMVSLTPVSSSTQHLSHIISQSEQSQEKNIFVQLSSPEANMWREYFVINSEKNINTCLVESNENPSEKEIKEDPGTNVTLEICDVDPLQVESTTNSLGKEETSGHQANKSNIQHSSNIGKQRARKRDSSVVIWKGKRKFREEWAHRFPWLRNENGSAFCTVCSKTMANMLSNLERHDRQQNHQLLMIQQDNEKEDTLSEDNDTMA